jgi:hypothetical protein
MSVCAVGGDPVRDLKLGDGADAAAGGAGGQDGAAARHLRFALGPIIRRRWSDRLTMLASPRLGLTEGPGPDSFLATTAPVSARPVGTPTREPALRVSRDRDATVGWGRVWQSHARHNES